MKPVTLFCAALIALGAVDMARAQHAERCEPIPKEQWRSKAELERKLTDMGWKIHRVKIENGCYEVYGFDERGGKVEVFFYPKTLERVTAARK